MRPDRHDRIAGALLGTAVGDALGLPREGLPPGRARRRFGAEPRHALLLGRGLLSDDTEHSCMVAQALLAEPEDPAAFSRRLAGKLRWWLAGLPAGVGLATLRAIGRLWLGFPVERSGVGSAGNGPAMRVALLGACLGGEPARLRPWVRAATRLTHTDPRAERAAFLVAYAAAHATRQDGATIDAAAVLSAALDAVGDRDPGLDRIVAAMRAGLARGATVGELALDLGLGRGVSGYAYDTVAVALYGWLRHPADFRTALSAVLACGGDTDTTGAIVGAIAGAAVGRRGIPREWIDGIVDWPRSVAWMDRLAERLARRFPAEGPADPAATPLPLFWPAIPARNLIFLGVILAHGLRRLLPPY